MENWTPDQLREHIEAGDQIFLKLWKKGCGACKLSTPAIERIEAAETSGLVFAQIGVDVHPEMQEIAETEVLPAFFIFRDKTMTAQRVGFKGIKTLQDLVAEGLGRSPAESAGS